MAAPRVDVEARVGQLPHEPFPDGHWRDEILAAPEEQGGCVMVLYFSSISSKRMPRTVSSSRARAGAIERTLDVVDQPLADHVGIVEAQGEPG